MFTSPRTAGLLLVCAAIAPACGALDDRDAVSGEANAAAALTVGAAPGLDAPDAEFLLTPIGRVHQSCVHVLETGAKVDAADRMTLPGGGSVQFAPCKYAVRDDRRPKAQATRPGATTNDVILNPNWKLAASSTVPSIGGFDWINGITGFWKVPAAPKQYVSQTVFLFVGVGPADGSAILQPVLQYGVSSSGGGNAWSMFLEYVSNGTNLFVSRAQRVSVGDTIEGYLSTDNCTNSGICDWHMSIYDGFQLPQTTTVTTSQVFRTAYEGVLETNNVRNCNQLPVEGDTGATFTNVQVFMPGPAVYDFNNVKPILGWNGTVNASGCSYGIINTADGVELFWD